MMIPLVAGFVPGRGGVTDDEAAAWADGLRGMGPDYFFALSRFMFLARRRRRGRSGCATRSRPDSRRRGRGRAPGSGGSPPSRPPLDRLGQLGDRARREHPAKEGRLVGILERATSKASPGLTVSATARARLASPAGARRRRPAKLAQGREHR